jgi:dihydropyrimidinase
MKYDLVIQGGTIITAERIVQADIGVNSEKIAAIGTGLTGQKSYDASDLYVIPGGVDAHVHLEMPTVTTITSDDWFTGTIAAACGGTTTVIDFVEPEKGETLLAALAHRQAQANGRTFVDYGLHMTLTNAEQGTLNQIPEVVTAGVSSFKTYTTFPGFRLSDQDFLTVFTAVNETGGLILVHAENDAMIQHSVKIQKKSGQLAPHHFPTSHPGLAEVEAIQRVILFAQVTGVPLYIVHISTAGGAQAVEKARKAGQSVYGETCPQYLLLDESRYQDPDPINSLKYVCTPPLRTIDDQQTLWAKLQSGSLQTVCTDHCAFNLYGQKDIGLDSFLEIPAGLPGIQTRLALLHTFGVNSGRLTLEQWVSYCSTAPAKIFGLYPHKGNLEVGADADMVIFDPDANVNLSKTELSQPAILHEQVDYTPYEGMHLQGWPTATFLRGRLIAQNGALIDSVPSGRFLHRSRPQKHPG